MQCYTECTDATAVNCSASLCFTSTNELNLVVSKTSLLQIYRVAECDNDDDTLEDTREPEDVGAETRRKLEGPDHEEAFDGGGLLLQRTQLETTTRLVLVAEYALSGSVVSMTKVRVPSCKTGADCLLLAIESAKVSLLQWDPATHSVSTISLHYYERDDLKSAVMPDHPINFLTSDPSNRCAALKFNHDMLAILPFRQKNDEDLMMEDGFDQKDREDTVMEDSTKEKQEKGAKAAETPYYPSFVVTANQLDEAIEQIIDVTFLHEYREPTFAILYQPIQTWTGMLEVLKDTVAFIVITLDLEQRASTPILSVTKLPYDIYKAVSLPPPISGTLLLGANEIIHIDQAGKTTAVAVNEYATKASAFPMTDNSELAIVLDGAVVTALEGEEGDVLIVTKEGVLLIISFKTDGRNVNSIHIKKVGKKGEDSFLAGRPNSIAYLGNRRLFVGSMEADSKLLGWRRRGERTGPSMKSEVVEEVLDNEDDDFDDDLYGDDAADQAKPLNANGTPKKDGKASGEYIFRTHDQLTNLGSCREVTFGKPALPADKVKLQVNAVKNLELVTTSGHGSEGGLTILRQSITPDVVGLFEWEDCLGVWAVRAHKREPQGPIAALLKGQPIVDEEINIEDEYDRYMIATKAEESVVFRVGSQFDELKNTDFDPSSATVNVGVVLDGLRILQVCDTDVKVYDSDLQLTQIIPMFDDETGLEPNVKSASFAGPYMLLYRDDESVVMYRCDEQSLEVEEVERSEGLKGAKFLAATLFEATQGEFSPDQTSTSYSCFLITKAGELHMYNLPDLETTVFVATNFDTYPLTVDRENAAARSKVRGNNITEVVVAYLGDKVSKSPFVLVRTIRDDVIIYEPFLEHTRDLNTLRFTKIKNPVLPSPHLGIDDTLGRSMVVLENIRGYAAVFMPGPSPTFVIKTSKSSPRLFTLAGEGVRSLSTFHTADTDRGFLYIDAKGIARVSLLQDFSYENTWMTKKVSLKETPLSVAYYPPMSAYVVSTIVKASHDAVIEDEVSKVEGEYASTQVAKKAGLKPEPNNGRLNLISALSWSIIDIYEFTENEVAVVVKTLNLEVSEHTKERKELIAVGTGVMKGEDATARGAIYVFEVISVIPEPGRPETNHKLKLLVREEVRGTVSAICGINGLLLASQGQKVMIRGLKEDMSLLPVAFMDMNMYVSVAKSMNNMILFGDMMKSVWFVGFNEEPYKLTLFGKDVQQMEVVAADFLPDGDQLYFVVADADSNVHILQFDPEHPKSLAGQRLIPKADFFAGHEIRTITMLPKQHALLSDFDDEDMLDDEKPKNTFVCLTSSLTGVFGIVTAVPETTYRSLNMIQGQLTTGEEHVAGLNPRAYRASRYRSTNTEVLRGVLDGAFIKRWLSLSTGRRKEFASRAGTSEEELRDDLWDLQEAVSFF